MRKDTISHFILRLAYCRSEDLRRWYLAQVHADYRQSPSLMLVPPVSFPSRLISYFLPSSHHLVSCYLLSRLPSSAFLFFRFYTCLAVQCRTMRPPGIRHVLVPFFRSGPVILLRVYRPLLFFSSLVFFVCSCGAKRHNAAQYLYDQSEAALLKHLTSSLFLLSYVPPPSPFIVCFFCFILILASALRSYGAMRYNTMRFNTTNRKPPCSSTGWRSCLPPRWANSSLSTGSLSRWSTPNGERL